MLNSYARHQVDLFAALGRRLAQPDERLAALIASEARHNAWFTPQSVSRAVQAIAVQLSEDSLTRWLTNYDLPARNAPKIIGLILAGNIPLVGFHDVLCTLLAGHKMQIKVSSNDARLILYILEQLTALEANIADSYQITNRLAGFDAVIATGSNNSSRYFDYYFGKVPHIIRKNRNSVALLTGTETTEQLHSLGYDVFDYYGLGCRNVSKLMVPEGYNFDAFFEAIQSHQEVINHHKYHNNYDYNKAILLVNKEKHLDNGFLLLKEDEKLTSPLAVLHYQTYKTFEEATAQLTAQADQIQCVVTAAPIEVPVQVTGFGCSQQPGLADYADGVDTLDFLLKL